MQDAVSGEPAESFVDYSQRLRFALARFGGAAREGVQGVAHTLLKAEQAISENSWLWSFLLMFLAGVLVTLYRSVIDSDWYRGGNDMIYILPAAKAALSHGWAAAGDWINGPWIGKELFVYYRPVTSVVWYALYRQFGAWSGPWQYLTVALHATSAVMLACLLRRFFVSPLAALAGAFLWGTHHQMAEALAWTPAMTDVLAGFFGIAALLVLQIALDSRRVGFLFPFAAALMVLAMGSKEIALTVPLLASLLILRAPNRRWSERLWMLIFVGAVLIGFFLWRTHALNGMGFMPGQHVPGRANAAPFTFVRWRDQMAKFLIPMPFNSLMGVSPLTSSIAYAALWLFLLQRTLRGRIVAATFGILVLNLLFDNAFAFLQTSVYEALFGGMATLALIAFVLWNRPRDAFFIAAWGLCAHLPLYHVVYNAVGNVTYLPETYWALANAALFATALDKMRGDS